MRALVQRVKKSKVTVDGKIVGSIGKGILILLGVKNGDTQADAEYLAKRCTALRIFEDNDQKMNLSVIDINGEILCVSQFTLYGETQRGNRPSYTDAAPPEIGERIYEHFNEELKRIIGEAKVKTGIFRAMMDVELVNDGPVTLIVESKNNSNNT